MAMSEATAQQEPTAWAAAPSPTTAASPTLFEPAPLEAEFSVEGGFETLPQHMDQLNEAHAAAAADSGWLSGLASWYSDKFHGRRTASGEPYLRHGFTIAHRQWPLGAKVSIRNPANGIKVIATVNDRGPFHPNRLIDVSFAIAKTLGIVQQGVAAVEVRLLDDADISLNLNDGPAATSVPKQGVKPPVQWPPKIK
jgi:rare lipoprotein A